MKHEVDQYLPLVRKLASLYYHRSRIPSSIEIDDLVQVGMIAVWESLPGYDKSRASAETYLSIRINGAMRDLLRQMDYLSRSVRDKSNRQNEAYTRLCAAMGRPPTLGEVEADTGATHETFAQEVEWSTAIDGVVQGIVDNPASTPESFLEDRQRVEQVVRALEALTPKQLDLLRLYYDSEIDFKTIGKLWGCTVSRISQQHTAIVKILKVKVGQQSWAISR